MRNLYKVSTLILTASFILSVNYSCQKKPLDQPIQGALNSTLLANKKGIESLLIGAYAALDGSSGGTSSLGGGSSWASSPSNFLHGSIAGGEAHKGAGGGSELPMAPFQRWNSMDPTNPYIDDKWKSDFEGVARANAVLRILSDATGMTEEERSNVEAQARFIRGHFYFDLKQNFNMIPWIDEKTEGYNTPNNIDIWPNIEADFKLAMDSLPETQTEIGRVNKWAAASYLGKTYLFENKFQEAKVIFDQVIAGGKTSGGVQYALDSRYHDNFQAATDNSPESVFAVQMVPDLATNDVSNSNGGDLLNFPTGLFPCCGIYIPSQDFVNSFRTDFSGLPYVDSYNQHPVKSDQGLASDNPFTPDDGPLDPRLDWSVGRRGVPYLDWGVHPGKAWIRDQNEGGAYSPVKNVFMQINKDKYGNYSSFGPGTAINLNVIRFSDVLLMAAEVEAQLGNLDIAEEYVNRVRNRVANPISWVYKYIDPANPLKGYSNVPAANYKISPYPDGMFSARGKDFALKSIYFERKLELGLEGHRYYDLSRWGIAAETINAYFKYESPITTDLVGAHFTKGRNEYYPIPQKQIDLTTVNGEPTLTQNSGY